MKRSTKVAIVVLVLSIGIGVFLNRSYAAIYRKIGEQHLTNPNTAKTYFIGGSRSDIRPMKYVALGDSLTAGVGVTSSREIFPYRLSERIATSGRSVELTDLGEPGARTQDLIDSQLQQAIAANPDVVTVLIGVNDVHGFVSKASFAERYETIVAELIGKTKAKIILINLPLLGTPQLVTWPYSWIYKQRTTSFNAAIDDIAKRYSLGVVDLYKTSEESTVNAPTYFSADQFHPSAEGYKMWSDAVYDQDADF